MGTCLDAYLDMHSDAAPPVRQWSTCSEWSLNKCYAFMRSLDRFASDSEECDVTAGWPADLASFEEEQEKEYADAGTMPIVVASARALAAVARLTESGEGRYPTIRALCAAMAEAEMSGARVRVLFVRG